MKEILLIEDDEAVANIILYYLGKNARYHLNWAKNAGEGLLYAKKEPDIILLDICLPDFDGIKLCAKLRETIYCPIIFISCLDDENTMVKALETGGDDYLAKPFSGKLLESHIESNLRRVKLERTRELTQKKVHSYEFEDFTLNCDNHILIRDNKEFHLAPIEYSILIYFIENPNRIISPDELYENIWDNQSYGDVRTVVTHVYNLRKIIEPNQKESKYINNIRGSGYCFNLRKQ